MKKNILFLLSLILCIDLCAQRISLSNNSPSVNYTKGLKCIDNNENEKGIALIRLAAGKGYLTAQEYMGNCYLNGIIVDKDYADAAYWFKLAAMNGSEKAVTELSKLLELGFLAEEQTSNGEMKSVFIQYQFNSNEKKEEFCKSNIQESNVDKSDVDLNIPITNTINTNTIVVIIANQNYQEESDVEFAINDGSIFKEYCISTLGIPDKHIRFRKNATLNNIITDLHWLKNVMQTFDHKNQSDIIFYYAGHGISDESTRISRILPIDGSGNLINSAYETEKLYKFLSELPATKVTVFMDACFSGANRCDEMLIAARAVAIKPKPVVAIDKLIIFSATSNDETAYSYKEKSHGMFTYFLLKKIQASQGNCTYKELGEFIYNNVTSKSIIENGKTQTPTVQSLMNGWGLYKLLK